MISAACEFTLSCSNYPCQKWPKKQVHHHVRASCSGPFASGKVIDNTSNCPKRRCHYFDFYKKLVPYKDAWLLQKSLVAKRHVLMDKDEDLSDMLIVLQHHPVYTLGTNSAEDNLNFDIKDAPFDLFRTERGGEVTYHGPGQLVIYPILNLRYHKMDLHWYLRSLEEVIIRVLSSSFSIKASRLDGLTGVWVGNQKVAAIGIRVTRWITYHGLALNVTADMTPFKHIVPCGIKNRQVGSIKGILEGSFSGHIDDKSLIDISHESLLKEFSEVFQLSIQPKFISDFGLSLNEKTVENDLQTSFSPF